MQRIFRLLSLMPLWLLHALGAVLGLWVWLFSATYRRRLRTNAALAGYGLGVQLCAAMHAGKMVCELPRLWLGSPVPLRWEERVGFEALVQSTFASGRGVIVLAPHLGCWEMVGQAVAQACFRGGEGPRMTVMYRPAKKPWLQGIVRVARERPAMRAVPAELGGVRQLLRALQAAEVVGVLPDQVPLAGMGVWSPVFGKAAYTMTLAARLAQATNAVCILCWCARLGWGRGYQMHTRVLALDLSADLPNVVGQINAGIERSIRSLPQQYLWGYARYKQPGEGGGGGHQGHERRSGDD